MMTRLWEPIFGLRDKKWFAITYIVFVLVLVHVSDATKCFKDESIGDRTGNVYYCDNPDEPDCCEEDGTFKCCEEKSSKTLREQLILWGSVAGVAVLIAITFVCLMKDVQCFSSEKTVKERCCLCCKKKNDEEEEYIPKEEYKTKYQPFHSSHHPVPSNSSNYDDLVIRPESTCSTLAAGNWNKYY